MLGDSQNRADDTTLVVYSNFSRKPIASDRKRDLARQCGVSFIKLRWKEMIDTVVGVSGFQHVRLSLVPQKGGRMAPHAAWSRNDITHEALAEGQMEFVPDEFGTGWAYLPDSPYNRVMLAKVDIGKNALWEIEDVTVHQEIEKLAEEIQGSSDHLAEVQDIERKQMETAVRVQESGVKIGADQRSRMSIQNDVLKAKIKELEEESERRALINRLAELKRKLGLAEVDTDNEVLPFGETTGGAAGEEVASCTETPFDKPDGVDKELRDQARRLVYAENASLITEIKEAQSKKTGRAVGWGFTPMYRDLIIPLIEAKMEKLRNEHTTVGIAS